MLLVNKKFPTKKFPTHMLIGVRKSATTWIWKQLSESPEIYVHPKKEIHFFNKFYNLGLDWYSGQFKTNKKIIIDTTPDYFFNIYAKKIKEILPETNLFVCLRNPMERAYSHWKFGVYIGNCKKNFRQSWNSDWNKIKTRGLYDQHLESFLEYYLMNSNFKIFLYDELLKNPNLFVNEIFDFIKAKRCDLKSINKKWMPGGVSEKGEENLYEKISNQKPSKLESNLIKDYYYKSIEKLEKILKINTKWLSS